jgi:hypothetical protein
MDVDTLFILFHFSVPIWGHITLVIPQKNWLRKLIKKPWIWTGIKISSQHKRDPYWLSRNNTNVKLKGNYKLYCKTFNNVITVAKRTWCNKQIQTTNNITKTACNIIKTYIGLKDTNEDFYWFNNDENDIHDYQSISNSFNTNFLAVAEKITQNITNDTITCNKKGILCTKLNVLWTVPHNISV